VPLSLPLAVAVESIPLLHKCIFNGWIALGITETPPFPSTGVAQPLSAHACAPHSNTNFLKLHSRDRVKGVWKAWGVSGCRIRATWPCSRPPFPFCVTNQLLELQYVLYNCGSSCIKLLCHRIS